MISSVVALGLFLLAAWRLRQVTDGAHTFRYINLIAVNHCEGCVKLRNGTIPISAPSSPSPAVERKDEILWARGK
jgi:hypothetical protein